MTAGRRQQGRGRLSPALDPKATAMPEALLAPRQRRMLSKAFASWPEPGFIGLPVPASRHPDVVAIGGYAFDGPFGPVSCIERRAVVQPGAQPFAPFIGRREITPIALQFAPVSSKADSLKAFLTSESWGRLEDAALETAGWVCEVCGDGAERCEAHEIWSYAFPLNPEFEGVQRLEGLACLCPGCHQMMRPRAAMIEGREGDLIAWLKEVNAFEEDEAVEMLRVARARGDEASRNDWVLDLAVIEGDVEIDPRWRIDEGSWRFVLDDGGLGGGTLPLNVGFVHDRQQYPAAAADEYYELLDALPRASGYR